MTDPVLLTERDGGIVTVTLNRPGAMNALSMELRNAIHDTFRALKDDASAQVVILTGAGRAFCAGLDLKELGGESGDAKASAASVSSGDMVEAITSFDRPVIGAINGVSITGGFELALACDVLIASTLARFADTHGRVGIMPGWGLSQRLPRMIGTSRAKMLSFTGNFLNGTEAAAWGLCAAVVEPDELMPFARKLAGDMLTLDQRTLRGIKRVIDEGFAGTFGDGLALEKRLSQAHMAEVTPEAIAERRKGIQERGRSQV